MCMRRSCFFRFSAKLKLLAQSEQCNLHFVFDDDDDAVSACLPICVDYIS